METLTSDQKANIIFTVTTTQYLQCVGEDSLWKLNKALKRIKHMSKKTTY
jgi:hypothetical protein